MIVHGWPFRRVMAALWYSLAVTALRDHGLHRGISALNRLRQMVTSTRSRRRLRKVVRIGSRHTFDLYTPAFPSRASQRFIEQEIRRNVPGAEGNVVQTAIVAITKECTLRCQHCCEWDSLNRAEVLTRDDLSMMVQQLRARGVTQIFFSGGEPLRRLDTLLAACGNAGGEIDFWIITSGVGLTSAVAKALHDAQFTGVVVSVDHWDARRHDEFRGRQGAFAAAMSAAANASDAGLGVAFSLCPTREFTAREELDRYAALAQRAGASFIQLLEPRQVGHYEGRDVLLNDSELATLASFSDDMNFNGKGGPIVTYPALYQRRHGCLGAAERYLYVDTNGDAHACPFCRHAAANIVTAGVDAVIDALRARGCPAGSGAGCSGGQLSALNSQLSREAS